MGACMLSIRRYGNMQIDMIFLQLAILDGVPLMAELICRCSSNVKLKVLGVSLAVKSSCHMYVKLTS